LITVNQELKNKVDEATRVNDDLQNFIASTNIAVLFVDREMRLRRFTPLAQHLFNVINTDLGRSLLDITHKIDYPELRDDIHDVIEKLTPVEREAQGANGQSYLIRALPYRTAEDRIGGVVLTFIDITRRREAEERIRRNEQ